MVETNAFQKAKVMAPQEIAAAAYEALMKAERVVVPGFANRALVFKRRFISEESQAKTNAKMHEDVPAKDQRRERGDAETEAALKE